MRSKRVRSERDRPPNREGTVTDLGETGKTPMLSRMQRARGRIVLDIHPSPFLPPFGIKISNETKPSSLPPPSLLLFFLVSPDVMLLRHEPKDRDNGTEIEREREREKSHRYPFLPPVMYQACPLAQPFGWETRDTLFSRGWVGFGIMNEIPPRWRVASVGVAASPYSAIFPPPPQECGNTKQ